VIENFLGTKSWRKFLEGLKRKVNILIGTKTYLTKKICSLCYCFVFCFPSAGINPNQLYLEFLNFDVRNYDILQY